MSMKIPAAIAATTLALIFATATPVTAQAASANASSFETAQEQGAKALDDIRDAYGAVKEKEPANAEKSIRAALADLAQAPKTSDVHLIHLPRRHWWSSGKWMSDRLAPVGGAALDVAETQGPPDLIGVGEDYEDNTSYVVAEHWDEVNGAAAQLFLPYYHTELYLNNALVHVQNKQFGKAKHSLDRIFDSAIIFGVGFDEVTPVSDVILGTAE